MRKKYKDEWFFNFPKSRGKGGNRRAEDKGEEREEKREERIGVKQKKQERRIKEKE